MSTTSSRKSAASVQGSGWGALTWEPLGERLFIEQIYDHQGNVGQGGAPAPRHRRVEYVYYLQYENRRPDYIAAIRNVIDWTDVACAIRTRTWPRPLTAMTKKRGT